MKIPLKIRERITMSVIALSVVSIMFTAAAGAIEKESEPYKLFYAANQNYEKREYEKAAKDYAAIIEMGLESGSLCYNLGNSFLKLGKLGYAILCYEKAKRIIPHDSDLDSNLTYARSLADISDDGGSPNLMVRAVNRIFGDYSLREIIFSATILYLLLLAIIGLFIFKPFLMRRFRLVQIVVTLLFAVNMAGVVMRYYDERILRHGIVVQKLVECKYEPIEKSTTYYTLREGGDVLVLSTRDGWRQIRRADHKAGWVKKEAVEEI